MRLMSIWLLKQEVSNSWLWRLRSCDWSFHCPSLHIWLPVGRAKPGQAEGWPVRLRVQEEPLFWPEDQEDTLPWQVTGCMSVNVPDLACVQIWFLLTWFFPVSRIGRPPKYRKNQQRDYQSEFSEVPALVGLTCNTSTLKSFLSWREITDVLVACCSSKISSIWQELQFSMMVAYLVNFSKV